MKREVERKYVLRTIICKRKPCKYYDQIGRRGNVGYKVKGDLFLLSETFWETSFGKKQQAFSQVNHFEKVTPNTGFAYS